MDKGQSTNNFHNNPTYLTKGIGGYKFIAKCMREYSEQHLGETITSEQIIEDIHDTYDCRRDEIMPSDYVINPDPARTAKMMEPRLFEKVDRGLYKCIGAIYSAKDKE